MSIKYPYFQVPISSFPSKAAHNVLIRITTKPANCEVGTRGASSLEQLLMFLRQDGLRVTFKGTKRG